MNLVLYRGYIYKNKLVLKSETQISERSDVHSLFELDASSGHVLMCTYLWSNHVWSQEIAIWIHKNKLIICQYAYAIVLSVAFAMAILKPDAVCAYTKIEQW